MLNTNLAQKTIIVTGASRGIGKAITNYLIEHGAFVIGTATRKDSNNGNAHPNLEMLYANFADPNELKSFCEKISQFKKIDGLVNNAGINIIKPLQDIISDDYDTLLSINLKAPFLISQAVAKVMMQNGKGHIINIASIWSEVSKPHRTLYSSAKTGLVGMTRSMAVELAPYNILVNAVSPGFTLTDLTYQSLTSDEINDLASKIPVKRMAQTNEIAELVGFLCSDSNTYITGQNIVIDGGFSIV